MDADLEAFRTRPLGHVEFPYVFADATYVKDRVNGRVVSRAVVVATGVTSTGDREVLGLAVGDSEDGPFGPRFSRACGPGAGPISAQDPSSRGGPALARASSVLRRVSRSSWARKCSEASLPPAPRTR